MDGLLIVDKPAGPTSHDVVARMRRALGERRIGHTGTLDPAATGVLGLVLGRATRLAQFLAASDKSYEAVVRFGFATDTGDAQGRATGPVRMAAMPARAEIDAALEAFRGTFLQQPPAFSAKKIDGKRSHRLARAHVRAGRLGLSRYSRPDGAGLPDLSGLPGLPAPVSVTAHSIAIVGIGAGTVTLRLACSAGFYVRSLAHDLGERLGVGAHLASLRRTRSGAFGLDRAIDLDTAERHPDRAKAAVIPLPEVLPGVPTFRLSAEGVRRAANGCTLGPRDSATGQSAIPHPPFNPQSASRNPQSLVRLLDPSGDLVGIARPSASSPGLLHPSVVLI
jgi:tRNA pseudouridine55 synthase